MLNITEEIKNCPICEESTFSQFIEGHINKELFEFFDVKAIKSKWSHCVNCNHVFLNPKFSKEVEIKLYGEESIYRKYSIGNQSLNQYLQTIDNTIGKTGVIHKTHLNNIKKILKYIKLNEKPSVLDFGAGFGAASSAIINQGMIYQGYEMDNFCLDLALKFERNVKKNIENSSNFDLVYSSQVFEHISEPIDAIKNASNFIKMGGYLFINVPTHQYKLFPPKNWGDGGLNCMNWGHFHSYTLESLLYLAETTDSLEYVASWYSNGDINVIFKKNKDVNKNLKFKYNTKNEIYKIKFAKLILNKIYKIIVAIKIIKNKFKR